MKVAIRADASTNLGSGHVMRCLTLADALRERGAEIRFVCRKLPGHMGDLITKKGYGLVWLSKYSSLAEDARDSYAALTDQAPWDWLVVDHYMLDAVWERELRAITDKLMVIDDLANRSYDCDLLLDQNLQEPGRYDGLIPETSAMLIGPKYALLRPQFAAARENLRVRDGRVSRLLVFFGGADADGETLKALSAIKMLGRPDIVIDVVLGQTNPHRQEIEAACRDLPNVALHCQVENMAELMAAADLFVGAGGTSSWERCCLGIPALSTAIADNQTAVCLALAKSGVVKYLGESTQTSVDSWCNGLNACIQDDWLVGASQRARELVDGLGAQRVVKAIWEVSA